MLCEHVRAQQIKGKSQTEIFGELFECCETLELSANTDLCKAGDASADLFILVRGHVACIGIDGTIYKEYQKGDVIGEIGFLQQVPRTLRLHCVKKSHLFKIHALEFARVLRENKMYGDAISLIWQKSGNGKGLAAKRHSGTTASSSTNSKENSRTSNEDLQRASKLMNGDMSSLPLPLPLPPPAPAAKRSIPSGSAKVKVEFCRRAYDL